MRTSVIDYMLFGTAIEVGKIVVEDLEKIGVGWITLSGATVSGEERSEKRRVV